MERRSYLDFLHLAALTEVMGAGSQCVNPVLLGLFSNGSARTIPSTCAHKSRQTLPSGSTMIAVASMTGVHSYQQSLRHQLGSVLLYLKQ